MRISSNKEGFSIGHVLKCLATVVSLLFFYVLIMTNCLSFKLRG